jgi:hypothetical protein
MIEAFISNIEAQDLDFEKESRKIQWIFHMSPAINKRVIK